MATRSHTHSAMITFTTQLNAERIAERGTASNSCDVALANRTPRSLRRRGWMRFLLSMAHACYYGWRWQISHSMMLLLYTCNNIFSSQSHNIVNNTIVQFKTPAAAFTISEQKIYVIKGRCQENVFRCWRKRDREVEHKTPRTCS